MDDLDTQIANIIQDYRDGLLDSIEDAVEAIKELQPFKQKSRLVGVKRTVIGGRDE